MATTRINKPLTVDYVRLDDVPVPVPSYKTSGSVAFDIATSATVTIPAGTHKLVPTGLIIGTPNGYVLLILARSSLFKRTGCMLTNSVGVIDNDYCGDEDEILISLWNTGPDAVTLYFGERIAQGLFVKVSEAAFHEVGSIKTDSRGGYGSTGVR